MLHLKRPKESKKSNVGLALSKSNKKNLGAKIQLLRARRVYLEVDEKRRKEDEMKEFDDEAEDENKDGG